MSDFEELIEAEEVLSPAEARFERLRNRAGLKTSPASISSSKSDIRFNLAADESGFRRYIFNDLICGYPRSSAAENLFFDSDVLDRQFALRAFAAEFDDCRNDQINRQQNERERGDAVDKFNVKSA